jgi:molecular chaperone DnaJ
LKKKDHYAILEIDQDASQAEVKKAYRRLARQYHPDMNPGDKVAEEKFKEIKEAYEILSNPFERDKYDREYDGEAATGSKPPPPGDAGDFGGATAAADYGDSGASAAAAGKTKDGMDLRYDLELSFQDAAFGMETEIQLQKDITCNVCYGDGAQPGTQVERCNFCQGTGKVTTERRTEFGVTTTQVQCSACYGKGKIVRVPCQQCNGQGTYTVVNPVYIRVPPGVEDGSRLRIRSKGEPGIEGGKDGDLYVVIHIAEHSIFERHGNEVLCETTITYSQAVLGAEIEIPTLEGSAKMKIPPGTQTGTVFRLRGKGIMDPNTGARGDQHVKVTIVTPTGLNDKQRSLLLKFAQAVGEDTRYYRK